MSSLKLHNEFLKLKHDARFYVMEKREELPGVVRIKSKGHPDILFYQPLRNSKETIASTGLGNARHEALATIYDWADVILLRWVTGALSDFQIGYWSKLQKKPVVWCLSDMAPFTGGCHYSAGCEGYQSECANCPVVNESRCVITPNKILFRRSNLWGDITLVSPSKWLKECAEKSLLFRGKDIRYIRTGVELDIFYPKRQIECRRNLNLPLDSKIIFSGAHSIRDYRKGFDLLATAINSNENLISNGESVVLVTAGWGGDVNLKVKTINFSHISNREILADLYSASDVTVLPYREDNLPNVMLESVACGTPVVSFAIGGIVDVIRNGFNGFTVPAYSTNKIALAIRQALHSTNFDRNAIREYAVNELDLRLQANRYIELFSEKLSETNQT